MARQLDVRYARMMFFLFGFAFLALGINLMITVPEFGLSPWDSFFLALRDKFGLTLGFWMFVANVFFLATVYILHRSYLSFATILNIVIISVFVDAIHAVGHSFLLLFPDVIAFFGGAVLIGVGIGMYVAASYGYAPQEGFMLAVSKKLNWSYRKTEILMSLVILVLSFLLDGAISYGTVFLTFAIGFIIQFSINGSKRILEKMETKENKGEYT